MLLEVKNVNTYYGISHILFDVSLEVKEGEVVCLLGRNGVGKTTTLRSIMGLTPLRTGSIVFQGQEIGKKQLVSIQAQRGCHRRAQVGAIDVDRHSHIVRALSGTNPIDRRRIGAQHRKRADQGGKAAVRVVHLQVIGPGGQTGRHSGIQLPLVN